VRDLRLESSGPREVEDHFQMEKTDTGMREREGFSVHTVVLWTGVLEDKDGSEMKRGR